LQAHAAPPGSEPSPAYAQWLADVVPQASITVLPRSGHFPHLADPDRFAECLATTGRWNHTGNRPHNEKV